MDIFKKLSLLVGVALFSFIAFATVSEASTITKTTMTINVDGVKEKETVILKDGRSYLPLRALSERFAGTTIKYDNQSKQISLLLNTYRPDSKYIISPLSTTKNYISQVNLDPTTATAKPVLKRFGSYVPEVYEQTTYLAIKDLSDLFDAEIEWEKSTNTIHILYKGITKDVGTVGKTKYRNALHYVNLVSNIYNDSYLPNYAYYEGITDIYKYTAKLPIGGYKKAFKAMEVLSDSIAMIPFNNEMTLLKKFYDAEKHYNGAKVTQNIFGFHVEVVPQTTNDIK